jgi:NCS1 family nucleobase:cation symporter-1
MGKLNFPTTSGMAAPFQSKEAFLNFVKAPQANEGHVAVGDPRWSNKDLEPTPEEHRNWTW